jgi:DNA-directed RNA polymerase specialized sigma subunit
VVKWRLAAAAGRVQDPLELQAAIQSAVRAMEKGRGTQAQVSAAYERAEAHTYAAVSYQETFSHDKEGGSAGVYTAEYALASPLPSPEELCSAKEDADRVQESLKGLEHRQQAILTSEMHGPSLMGLAEELGVSRTRLYQQRSKAHGHLRKKLAEDGLTLRARSG